MAWAALASPALAQDQAAEAVGAVVGGAIGLVFAVVVGAIVGWLASLIVKGSGSGFWGDVLFGIGGSWLAGWLLPALGISFGNSLIGALLAMLIGAVVLILIVRLIRKAAT